MTDRDALIAGIVANPEDTHRRLLFADFLEEQGDYDRAEFIRVQCAVHELMPTCPCGTCQGVLPKGMHDDATCLFADLRKRGQSLLLAVYDGSCRWKTWSAGIDLEIATLGQNSERFASVRFARGFVTEIDSYLAWFRHRQCPECEYWAADFSRPIQDSHQHCRTCRGAKMVPGNLSKIVKLHPIEFVGVTDKRPRPFLDGSGTWYDDGHQWADGLQGGPDHLPREVFQLLKGGQLLGSTHERVYPPGEAQKALSAALLTEARAKMITFDDSTK